MAIRKIVEQIPHSSRTFLLRAGTLTSHTGCCLMLLGSPPDIVHRPMLRKTRPSTESRTRCNTLFALGSIVAPATADCRYRAPLSPRVVWPYSIPLFIKVYHKPFVISIPNFVFCFSLM